MVVLKTQVAMQLMNLQNKATHLGKGTFIADMSPTGSVIDLKKNDKQARKLALSNCSNSCMIDLKGAVHKEWYSDTMSTDENCSHRVPCRKNYNRYFAKVANDKKR